MGRTEDIRKDIFLGDSDLKPRLKDHGNRKAATIGSGSEKYICDDRVDIPFIDISSTAPAPLEF